MKRFASFLALLFAAGALNAQVYPEYALHPTGACSPNQYLQFLTASRTPLTCAQIAYAQITNVPGVFGASGSSHSSGLVPDPGSSSGTTRYLREDSTFAVPPTSTGPAGADGKTVRNGSGAPSGGLGIDGDFYIDTAANAIYGPKASGAWGSSTSLIGPTGATGATGTTGAAGATGATGAAGSAGSAGANGATWRTGSGVPSNSLGVDGDLYLRTATSDVYQRASGTYSIVANILGATGSTGATGPSGAGYLATSATSLTTAGSGSKSFTTQSGLAYSVGARVRATSSGTGDWMEGVVTSYSSTTLVVAMDNNSGTGTHADWNINVAGQSTGITGPSGPIGLSGGSLNLSVNTSSVSNASTAETGLMTYTLAASLLQNAGDNFSFVAQGSIANNSNAKRLKVIFGAATIFDSGASNLPVSQAYDWVLRGSVTYLTSTTQICQVDFNSGATSYTASAAVNSSSETLTASVIFKLTGTGGASNDVTEKYLSV
ncbi:MAG: hypothetical protein ACREPT_14270, partial [Rudaea sp.]